MLWLFKGRCGLGYFQMEAADSLRPMPSRQSNKIGSRWKNSHFKASKKIYFSAGVWDDDLCTALWWWAVYSAKIKETWSIPICINNIPQFNHTGGMDWIGWKITIYMFNVDILIPHRMILNIVGHQDMLETPWGHTFDLYTWNVQI